MVYISVQPAQHCSKATWINSLMVINTFVKQEGKKVIGKTYWRYVVINFLFYSCQKAKVKKNFFVIGDEMKVFFGNARTSA